MNWMNLFLPLKPLKVIFKSKSEKDTENTF